MAITTVERVFGMRAGLSPQLQVKVTRCLTATERYVIGKLGYDPAQVLGTVRASGRGSQILPLPGPIPITAVSSLVVDKVAWTIMNPGDADTDQYAWIPDHGDWIEARDGRVFSDGTGNIACTRTAGYAPVGSTPGSPEDLQEAVALATLLLLDMPDGLGRASRTLGTDSIETYARDLDNYQFLRDVIEHYRKRFF